MELWITHALSVGLEIEQTTPRFFGVGYLPANGGEQRMELSAIKFFMSFLSPLNGAQRGEAIESFTELTQVLLGMKAVHDLDGPRKQLRDQIPDPRGTISERRSTRRLGETAPLGLTPDTLSKDGTFLGDVRNESTLDGCRIADRSFIADRSAIAIERFCTSDGAEFDLPSLRGTLPLTGHASQFLSSQRDPGSIDAQVERLGQRNSVQRFAVTALVFGDFLAQSFGGAFHLLGIHHHPDEFLQQLAAFLKTDHGADRAGHARECRRQRGVLHP